MQKILTLINLFL